MSTNKSANSKTILYLFLAIMAVMIVVGIVFYTQIKEFLSIPYLYPHFLFIHVVSVTLFFANAVIGMLWEARSLVSGKKEVILHTYSTVSWLDARFSSPLIIASVASGIVLTVINGDIWEIGWLSIAFILFLFSGVFWVVSDIPTQYKVKELMGKLDPDDSQLPSELVMILKKRVWISLAGVFPLVIVFILMMYKPDITPIPLWFR